MIILERRLSTPLCLDALTVLELVSRSRSIAMWSNCRPFLLLPLLARLGDWRLYRPYQMILARYNIFPCSCSFPLLFRCYRPFSKIIISDKMVWYIKLEWFCIYRSFNHEMFTFPLFIPLNSPTTCMSAYGNIGSFKLGFFCWAILNNVFHFSSILAFSFLTNLGSWIAK